jgi:hypothetical protein
MNTKDFIRLGVPLGEQVRKPWSEICRKLLTIKMARPVGLEPTTF